MWCPNQECPDAIENGAPGEFREGIIRCPLCDAGLVSYLPEWAGTPPERADVDLVPCLTVADISLLPQLKAMLDSAEVRYFIKDEGVQNLFGWGTAALGFNPETGPPVLLVEASDLGRAEEALGDLKEAIQKGPGPVPESVGSSWPAPSSCAKCGKALETSEGDEPLTACYHCGEPLHSRT
jgi:hypothetical protein